MSSLLSFELEVVAGQVEATPATEVVDVDSYADSVDSPIPSFRDRLMDDHAGISAADYINRVVAFGLVASSWVRELPATDNASHQAFTREIDEFLMLCAKQVSNKSSTKTHAAFHRLDVLLQQDLEFMGIEWNRLKVAKSKLPDVCEPEKLTSDEESEGDIAALPFLIVDEAEFVASPLYSLLHEADFAASLLDMKQIVAY